MLSNLSKLSEKIQPSATIQLIAKAKELIAEGNNIVNLSVGEPDFETPLYIKEAAKKAIDEGFTRYLPSSGTLELRESVANHTNKLLSTDYNFRNVSITSGCKHAIISALLSICNDGDEVIIPTPYWVSYPYSVFLARANPVFVNTERTNFILDPKNLEKKITDKTKAIIINSPSNPVGNVYKKEDLIKIWEVVKKYPNIYIISDEIYNYLIYNNLKHFSTAEISEEAKDRTIIVDGVSKTFAMTGWRIGWLIANEKIIKISSKIQSHTTSCASSISQKAANAALNGDMSDIYNMKVAYEKRKNLIKKLLDNIPNISFVPPEGAFYVWVDISFFFNKYINSKLIKNSEDISNYLLKEKYLVVVPGSAFGNDSYIRISYAKSEEEITEGLKRFKDALSLIK